MFMRHGKVGSVGVCARAVIIALFGVTLPVAVFAQSLPSPWQTSTIGSPSPSGSATYSAPAFSLSAGGVDIWGTSDQFRFVYQQVAGDLDVVARIDSFTAADPWSKIGVMIRTDLSAGSAHAYAIVSGAHGAAFQRRPSAGATSLNTAGSMVSAPRWVRLKRVGTTLTAYSGADGATWENMGSATIALGATAYVGLAVTSHNPGSLASAVVSNVTITPKGLPTGQQTNDIGSPALAGSTSYSSGTYTINAGGSDIWNTSDQFRYVYQPISGDVDIVARVNSVKNTYTWAKAGVMIRESLSANARNAMTLITAGTGSSFQWRLTAGAATDSFRGTQTPPGWVRLVRTGTKFEGFTSTNGTTWTSLGSQTIAMSDNAYVGIAVTSHNTSALTTGVVDQLKITAAMTPTNQLPSVSLTAPASAASFTAPANITVSANAADPENRLDHVEFYSNGTRIGTDATSPFSIAWSAVPVGTYSLTAKAFDLDGGSATSAAVTINVQTAANQLPTASLTSPAAGASFASGASVALAATASDPEGRLSKVEFYVGSTLVGTDTTSPYAATWTAGAAGSYVVKAIAYDLDGGSMASATRTITVTGTVTLPKTVTFQKSPDHATLVTSYRLDVFANGANPATATPIAKVSLGKPTPNASGDISVDESAFFTALAPATYLATVTAIGSAGESRSTAVTFTR
jgi:regulation of enolase protein 1 (concanavalin A-like superfamily)